MPRIFEHFQLGVFRRALEQGVKMTTRVIGAFVLLAGLVLGYLGAWMPLTEAAAHKDSVTLYAKAAVVCPVALVFGLIYLIFNEKQADEMLGERDARKPMFWILCVITAIAGLALSFWIEAGLVAAGYK